MATKEYLARSFHINQRIEIMSAQIVSLRSLAERIIPVLSDMPRIKKNSKGMAEESVVRIVALETDMKN